MYQFTLRNIKVFFKDKASVFFSLISVFIIIGLYILFLGDVMEKGMANLGDHRRFLMDSWIMAGLLSVSSITTTMGAFGIMVEDKYKKVIKDFSSSPILRFNIAGGYVLSSVFVGIIMSLITLILAEVYIVIYGGKLLSFIQLIKVLGLILVSVLCNSSMVYFIVSFFKSANAFATASTIIGTIIGFITGIYIPIGQLPNAVQFVVKLFPPSYSAILFRQVMMETPLDLVFNNAPEGIRAGFEKDLGVTFQYGDFIVPAILSVSILIITAIFFFGLSIIRLNKKNK